MILVKLKLTATTQFADLIKLVPAIINIEKLFTVGPSHED
jgi:hypothetical protein